MFCRQVLRVWAAGLDTMLVPVVNHHLSFYWNRQKLQLQNILSNENDKPNKEEIHLACPCRPVVKGADHLAATSHFGFWLEAFVAFFFCPHELINTYLHCYSYTPWTLTNCRLTSRLKQPIWGMSGSLCLVLGYWQPLVHSHCSLACLLRFHKHSEWPIYFSEGGEVTLLVDQQAGKLAHSDEAVMCSTINGLATDWSVLSCAPAGLFLLPRAVIVWKGQCMQ